MAGGKQSRKGRRGPASKGGEPPAKRDAAAELEAWRKSFQWFVEGCEARVGALLRGRGLDGPEVEVTLGSGSPHEPPTCRVCYKGPAAQIAFEVNYFGEVWAAVTSGTPPRSYGVRWFMEELAPGEAPSMAPREGALRPEESLAIVDRYAGFLGEHLDALLAAEPALLDRIAARIRAAVAGS